jgi:uncharacterized protein (UPF0276 family)
LRPVHFEQALSNPFPVDFVEVIAENYLGESPIPAYNLQRAVARGPILLHGVSLNLLGPDPLDFKHLQKVRELILKIDAPYFTDHLCWSSYQEWNSADLLPTPYTHDLIDHAAQRARTVQEELGVPFGIENLSSYVQFKNSTMNEWEFYNKVVFESDTHYMLDINNIYVSAQNHGFDPVVYLESINWDKVLYTHLAGHSTRSDGLIIDTHDAPVCDEVWELYRKAWIIGGPFPTLIEWDDKLPTWETLVAEAHKAKQVRNG